MKRLAGSLVLLVALPLFAVPIVSAWTGAPAPQATGPIQMEPVVVYNVTGGTLTGTLHRQLTVYNNGFATIAKFDQPVFPQPDEIQEVRTAQVGPDGALTLLLSLVQAGAVQLNDQPFPISDVPLKTLTILEGKTFGLSRTFSWYLGGSYGAIDQIVNKFIAETFPGF